MSGYTFTRKLRMNPTRAVALAALLLGGAAAPSAFAQRPDLAGRWTFNAAQSDNPRAMLQAGDSAGGESRGGRGGRGWGGRRGGTEGGGGGRGGMNDEQRARQRQTMQLVFEPPPAFTIAQTDSTVGFAPDSGAALVLYSDGRKLKQPVEGGGDLELKARWQGYDLVVERTVSGGGKVTEDYLRSQDGKQLFVIVNFEGARGRPITFRRVYDRA
jgi:hypothetical protein